MKPAPNDNVATVLVVGLVVVGGVAYYLLATPQGQALLRPRTEPNPNAGDPLTAVVNQLGSLLSQGLTQANDPNSAIRIAGRKAGDTAAQALDTLGFVTSATKKDREEKKAVHFEASSLQERTFAQTFAQRAFVFASQTDVREWYIQPDGTWVILYRYRAEPVYLRPPEQAINKAAIGAELVFRLFGRYVSRGIGPVRGDLEFASEPAFADNNAFAPLELRDTENALYWQAKREEFLAKYPELRTDPVAVAVEQPGLARKGLDPLLDAAI